MHERVALPAVGDRGVRGAGDEAVPVDIEGLRRPRHAVVVDPVAADRRRERVHVGVRVVAVIVEGARHPVGTAQGEPVPVEVVELVDEPVAVVVDPVADLEHERAHERVGVVAVLAVAGRVAVQVHPLGGGAVAVVVAGVGAGLGQVRRDGGIGVVAVGAGQAPVAVAVDLADEQGSVAVRVPAVAQLDRAGVDARVPLAAVGADRGAVAIEVDELGQEDDAVAVRVHAVAQLGGAEVDRRVIVVAVAGVRGHPVAVEVVADHAVAVEIEAQGRHFGGAGVVGGVPLHAVSPPQRQQPGTREHRGAHDVAVAVGVVLVGVQPGAVVVGAIADIEGEARMGQGVAVVAVVAAEEPVAVAVRLAAGGLAARVAVGVQAVAELGGARRRGPGRVVAVAVQIGLAVVGEAEIVRREDGVRVAEAVSVVVHEAGRAVEAVAVRVGRVVGQLVGARVDLRVAVVAVHVREVAVEVHVLDPEGCPQVHAGGLVAPASVEPAPVLPGGPGPVVPDPSRPPDEGRVGGDAVDVDADDVRGAPRPGDGGTLPGGPQVEGEAGRHDLGLQPDLAGALERAGEGLDPEARAQVAAAAGEDAGPVGAHGAGRGGEGVSARGVEGVAVDEAQAAFVGAGLGEVARVCQQELREAVAVDVPAPRHREGQPVEIGAGPVRGLVRGIGPARVPQVQRGPAVSPQRGRQPEDQIGEAVTVLVPRPPERRRARGRRDPHLHEQRGAREGGRGAREDQDLADPPGFVPARGAHPQIGEAVAVHVTQPGEGGAELRRVLPPEHLPDLREGAGGRPAPQARPPLAGERVAPHGAADQEIVDAVARRVPHRRQGRAEGRPPVVDLQHRRARGVQAGGAPPVHVHQPLV